jgi:signal transduction histidine kinase
MDGRPVIALRLAHQRVLLPALLVGSLILGALGFSAYWRSPTRGLPYHDSFAQSKDEEWQAFGGTWELSDGSMRDDSNERGAKLFSGSRYWHNYSIEADVMVLNATGSASDVGFILRSNDEEEGVYAYIGYFAVLHKTRGLASTLTLGRAGHGIYGYNSPLQPDLQSSRWYHLKVLAYGCRLVATASLSSTATPTMVSMTDDDCIRSGRIGLQSSHSGGVWRNVVVRPATERDLDEMLAQGQPHKNSSVQAQPDAGVSSLDDSRASPSGMGARELPSRPNIAPIGNLRLDLLVQSAKVTVHGRVILTSPALYVQDATGGIAIQQAVPRPLKIGDEVEATGDASPNAFSSVLKNAKVRVLWESTPIPAVSVTASQAATGAFDATFIEVEGRLRNKQYLPNNSLRFDFDAGSQSFRAIINRERGGSLYNRIEPDSLVRLRGVAVVDPSYTSYSTPFAVLVPSIDDVEVLAGPPWWSLGHLSVIAVGLLILALITNLLYQRLENWRLRAVVEEREVLAYEVHDSLSQSVAGIAFQLEAVRVGIPEELTKVHQQLDLTTDLVRHSHREARRSVDMLRSHQLESEGLLGALTTCAHRLVAGSDVQVVATSIGNAPPLTLRLSDTLCRIGQEALANAIRHAHPTKLVIHLEYSENLLLMHISDDGTGFVEDPNQPSFGVLGMRKRAMSISAKLEIRSNLGEGTTVSIAAPLPSRVTITALPWLLFRFLKEHLPCQSHRKS